MSGLSTRLRVWNQAPFESSLPRKLLAHWLLNLETDCADIHMCKPRVANAQRDKLHLRTRESAKESGYLGTKIDRCWSQ